MPTTYTAYLRLPKPDFNTSPWHTQMHQSIDAIDSAIYNALILQSMSTWANETAFVIGARVVDSTDGTLWLCAVAHTSAASPTTFAADRLANPTYWSVIAPGIQ